MKLSPSTIAANLTAAAIAEAEAADNNPGNNNNNNSSNNSFANANTGLATIASSNTSTTIAVASNVTSNLLSTSSSSLAANIAQSGSTCLASASATTAAMTSNISSTGAASNMAASNETMGHKTTPKDTQTIVAILKEMGIPDYDPRILPQLVEFAYRYSSKVLEDAQLFSFYAKKKIIDTDDVNLAIQTQFDKSFVGPPSRDVLLEIARAKNAQPLPPIKSHNGLRLPADRFSLVATNVRLESGFNQ